MRIGGIFMGKSRREERREKESAGPSAEGAEGRVRPAKLKKGVRRVSAVVLPPDEALDPRDASGKPLPAQEELLHTNIRPQHQVELVVSRDLLGEGLDVRQSIILDTDDAGRLYLAQTTPPLLRSDIGRDLELSFLSRYRDVPGGRWLRVGYHAPVLDVINKYQVTPDFTEPVIVVQGPKELKAGTLRLAFRVAPPEDLDLRLVLIPGYDSVGLLDFSATGARFYHDSSWSFEQGKPLNLGLISGRLFLTLTEKIARTDTIRDRFGEGKGLTSVLFEGLDPHTQNGLDQLLNETYRHLLAQRSGVRQPGD